MYTVILMAALNGGVATPDFGRRGCRGCNGGGYYSSCHSGYGYNGYGCGGGGGGYGCSGSGYQGGHHGGCSGSYGHGYDCTGGGYGAYQGAGYGPYQGGGYGSYQGGPGMRGPSEQIPGPTPKGGKGPTDGKDQGKGMSDEVSNKVRSLLIVELPQDANLFINDTPTNVQSTRRVFQTPPLEQGYRYTYTLRAEVVRDGQTVSQEQTVSFRPGEEARANFSGLTPQAASVSIR